MKNRKGAWETGLDDKIRAQLKESKRMRLIGFQHFPRD
jgi:hypothetical protein